MSKTIIMSLPAAVLLLCCLATTGAADVAVPDQNPESSAQQNPHPQEKKSHDKQNPETDEGRLKDEFLRDKQALFALAAAKDLDQTRELADALHAKWSQPGMDPNFHGHLMLDVVRQIDVVEHLKWKEHYAELALRNAEDLTLWLEVQLLRRLRNLDVLHKRLSPEEWSQRRTVQMRHWFHVYRRINSKAEEDPPVWKSKLRFRGIYPPIPPSLENGPFALGAVVDPAIIEDPQERKVYVQALEEHRLYWKKYQDQKEARRLQKEFIPIAEKQIVSAYAHPPYNDDELKDLLNEFVADETRRQRILEKVANAK